MANFSARVNGLLGGSLPWSFGFWLTAALAEGTVSTDFNNAVNTLFTTATNGLENFMSSDVTVTGTAVSTLNSTMHQTTKTSASLTITGTDANASLPWNVAEVLTLRSANATKWGHGRIYLPPFAEDQVTAHVIKAATMTSMQTVFNAFFASLTGAGISFFIFNKVQRKDGTAPYTVTAITGYDLSNKPAQQRRRVSKVVPGRTIGTL
jgi:hypothetical protein